MSSDELYLYISLHDSNGDLTPFYFYRTSTVDAFSDSHPVSFVGSDGGQLTLPFFDMHLSADGRSLYFANSFSIFRGNLSPQYVYDVVSVAGLGDGIDGGLIRTNGHPVVTKDQRRIFFSSFRPENVDGSVNGVVTTSDIWTAERDDALGDFRGVTNLGAPINTMFNEAPLFLTEDQCVLYFSSTRLGSNDIWQAERE